ncbi:MAG: tRNA (N6-isopentenyl adenosine(37)-C2)-methylthiotransferase MiaB [Planctomycetota bacterium]
MNDRKKILLKTFGCQMNRLDSELILSSLLGDGYVATPEEGDADVILFNTCSVRRHAEEKVFSQLGLLKALKSAKPGLVVGVIGCMAVNRHRDIRSSMPFVNLICGPGQFYCLPGLINRAFAGENVLAVEETNRAPARKGTRRESPFRASIAVMRGCDNFCSYCVVPFVRGRETSRPVDEVVEEARRLADDGCIEITLLGQNVSRYGRNLAPRADLADLLVRMNEIEGLQRIRFITSHPASMSEKILDAMASLDKVCEYLHLPAQSGSDRILKAMKRGYDAARYGEILDYARANVPGIEIASDFIVGFPGETEKDFAASLELVESADFLNCFVFKYSPRPGTAAAELPDDVPPKEKKRRNNILLEAQEKISLRRRKELIGKTVEVVVEGPSARNPAMAVGRTSNNYIAHFEAGEELTGKVAQVEITAATPLTVSGKLPACCKRTEDTH